MTIVRLDLAYHGAGFAGWAAQPGERTVQAELEGALGEVLGARGEADRRGPHRRGGPRLGPGRQLRARRRAPGLLARALNALTGDDLTVWSAAPAPDGFDARGDALSRTYCYRVLAAPTPSPFERGLSLFWPHKVYPGLLERCAEALAGSHDFTAFTPTQTEHVRFERKILRAEWKRGRALGHEQRAREGVELFEFWIEADAFMRNMVRVLVGTMLEVGAGRRQLDDFVALLGGAPREAAGDTARPHGLFLASVRY